MKEGVGERGKGGRDDERERRKEGGRGKEREREREREDSVMGEERGSETHKEG